jgi:hypothetical protein
MRRSHVATALLTLAAGLTAAAALRRFRVRRAAATAVPVGAPPAPVVAVPVPVVAVPAPVVAAPAPALASVPAPEPDHDSVVLSFAPRGGVPPLPARPAAPARCGDSGGRTKAGSPCGARGTSGGRCRHHPLAA